jgi:hypothetical protein
VFVHEKDAIHEALLRLQHSKSSCQTFRFFNRLIELADCALCGVRFMLQMFQFALAGTLQLAVERPIAPNGVPDEGARKSKPTKYAKFGKRPLRQRCKQGINVPQERCCIYGVRLLVERNHPTEIRRL